MAGGDCSQIGSPAAWRAALIGAIVLPCLYLINVTEPFDFVDDGAIVYRIHADGLFQWLEQIWRMTLAEFDQRGLFRPTIWLFYQTIAAAVGSHPIGWRVVWVVWGMAASVSMVTLLRELRVGPAAALFATALAMWGALRNEIWMALGLTEAIAMPFAMLSLICAIRAAARTPSIGWDALGLICSLLMLGTKNVFAAVVPAQVLLRIAAGEGSFGEQLRKRWPAAVAWSMPLLLPITHLLFFKLYWRPQPGGYELGMPTWRGVGRTLAAYLKAANLPSIAVGLIVALAALISRETKGRSHGWLAALRRLAAQIRDRYALALLAGGLLLVCGFAVYLPFRVPQDSIPGRYTIPAVWGLDLMIAVFLSAFFAAPRSKLKLAAIVALAAGLVATAAGTLIKSEKTAARARLLTDVLENVRNRTPSPSCIGWLYGAMDAAAGQPLSDSEAVHFLWHLQHGAHLGAELAVHDVKDSGGLSCGSGKPSPTILVSGQPVLPGGIGGWKASAQFQRRYWSGLYQAYVWTRSEADPSR
jgi:hypothetical protein